MNLSSLHVPAGQKHAPKRVGRGMGSGHGKTAGRGSKGQGSRAGTKRGRRGFEGGQMPYQRRLPKRGFHNMFRKQYAIVNLKQIAQLGEAAISPEVLLARGVISKLYDGVKILGEGELPTPVNVSAHRFSQSAREKILKAGGQAEVLS
ncbi:MAG: 50S ribosomal protein L15 [Acidobacteria bacterium RIFCSPLOWO2_12_FULL_59_11]|nr:MAG: 50S ribosomal protein L15 [Acidobacteria bacterium RIFCSPLOWO2_12_FULL_59_11]